MKLTIKTLQQKQLQLEVNEDDTVKSVKTKIEETEHVDPVRQMLIFQGKILSDDSIIGSYNIKENDFVVMMATKPSTTKPPTQSSSGSLQPAAPTPPSEPLPKTTQEIPVSQPPGRIDPSTLVTGTVYEAAVQNLMEMGFERDQVVRALHASYNNPDRAAEYLFSGQIPTEPQATESQTTTGALGFLRDDPYFQQIRVAIRRHPQSIPALLHQIGTTNPRLLQLINDNQEEFIALLNEDGEIIEEEHDDSGQEEELDMDPEELQAILSNDANRTITTTNEQQGGNMGAPQLQFVQVTAAEREAIDRVSTAISYE